MAFHDTGRAKPFGARCGRGSRTMPRKFSWQLADGSWWSLEANPGDATVSHQLPTINLVAAATGRGPPDGGRDSSARGWRCAPTGVGVSPNGGFDLPQRRVSLPPTERKPSPDMTSSPRRVFACLRVFACAMPCMFACLRVSTREMPLGTPMRTKVNSVVYNRFGDLRFRLRGA